MIDLFWWSPLRMVKPLRREFTHNYRVWGRLLTTGRPYLNFGDELSSLVVSHAFQSPVSWASPKKAEMVAIGSILELYDVLGGRDAVVWGSGARGDNTTQNPQRPARRPNRFLAVRGPRTASALGLPSEAIPFGDPGLLAMMLVSPRLTPPRRREIVYLPHFRTWGSAVGRESLRSARLAGARILPPTAKPLDVINAVAAAEALVTSSLHGIVVAHSLGIPVQAVTVPGMGAQEPLFKYQDYAASMGTEVPMVDALQMFEPRPESLAARFEVARAVAPTLQLRAEGLANRLIAVARSL